MVDIDMRLSEAVGQYWSTRVSQSQKQQDLGRTDSGNRSAVTGGKQMESFTDIAVEIAMRAGIPRTSIFQSKSVVLPGYFRPTKKWDFLVVDGGALVAAVEFKSHVGPSFGNNFNNRLEESLGTATDLWTAFREGAFPTSRRPWLGYFIVVEDCPDSRSPVEVTEPHFPVFPEFKGASYAKRYELMLTKLLRERQYDGCGLLLSKRLPPTVSAGPKDLEGKVFFNQLHRHLVAHAEDGRL